MRLPFVIQNTCCAIALSAVFSVPAIAEGLSADLPPQPLVQALDVFSAQTGLQLVYRPEIASGRQTKGARAGQAVENTLRELLRDTGLTYRFVNERTVTIQSIEAIVGDRSLEPEADSQTIASSRPHAVAMAQVNPGTDTPPLSSRATPSYSEETQNKAAEIVVTGSHIRGSRSASPVQIFDREDIARTGVATVDQFVETLSQNFGGGASQDSSGSPGSEAAAGRGSAVNLRGLGAGATLVLLNGRRVAPGGLNGNYLDTSMIPMSAVERIEVLTDGASAIYGSDAVGGVVNFILRDTYEGAETALRYGSVTEGHSSEYSASQSLGANWDSGSALVSYEYYHRDDLAAKDRSYAQSALDPRTLLPKQDRHSVFVNARQRLSDALSLFSDLLYSRRETGSFNTSSGGIITAVPATNKQLSVSAGAKYRFGRNWNSQWAAGYSTFDLDAVSRNTTGTANPLNDETDVRTLDALIDGTVFDLPGGPLAVAFGASHREDNYSNYQNLPAPDRSVSAAFGEFSIPLVGAPNRRQGIEALELSAALRYEDYSDFGSAATPKFGVRWVPVAGLNLRATYGESFKAPTLQQLSVQDRVVILRVGIYGVPGNPIALFRSGAGNPDLIQEESRSWTAGFDFNPDWLPFSVTATYYDIDFDGRIARPVATTANYFVNSSQYGELYRVNPGAAAVSSLIANAEVVQVNGVPTPVDPASVSIVIDDRINNISEAHQSGIDLTLDWPLRTEFAQFNFTVGGTYIDTFEQRTLAAGPVLTTKNFYGAPIDLRLRGGASLQRKGLIASLFANYQDAYKNLDATFSKISSWTTFDLNIRYGMPEGRGGLFLSNTALSLSARNLFDKDPPFSRTPGFVSANPGYDANNADPLGRFVAVEVSRRW